MPDLTASIPHQLGRAEAKRRIQAHAEEFRQSYGSMVTNLRETRREDELAFSFTVMGQAISGRLLVGDTTVDLTVILPVLLHALARPFQPRIEQDVRRLLSHAHHDAAPQS